MKITYINEAVRLPSGASKKVSLADISVVNEKYIKQQICSIINEEFKNITGYDSIDLPVLTRMCLHYSKNEYEYYHNEFVDLRQQAALFGKDDDTLDFSPGISIKPDNTGAFIVYLCITNNPKRTLLYADMNKFLNDICNRHSNLISDIRLKNICVDVLNDGTLLSQNVDAHSVETIPFPLSREMYYSNMIRKNVVTKIINKFTVILQLSSKYVTNDQWKNMVEYTLRFDDVTNEGIECCIDTVKGDMTTPGTAVALKTLVNDVFPKFKFKFSKIYINTFNPNYNGPIRQIKETIFSDIFNKQNISSFAHDVNKFYVKLEYKILYEYIKTNAKLYMSKYSQEEKILIDDALYYILRRDEFIFVQSKIDAGYYPMLDKLGFICANNTSLSPKDMFIPVEKFIDFIFDNRYDDIDSIIKKFFNIS